MSDLLGIGQIARRTGLSVRTLRFYEARGLLSPPRAYNGRRSYGPADLERISQIVALKRAGLTLTQIEQLLSRGSIDLSWLIDTQLQALHAHETDAAEARSALLSVKRRLDNGEPVDVEAFCALIRHRDSFGPSIAWAAAVENYFSSEETEGWAEKLAGLPHGFDQEDYGRKWQALSARIEAALPLDPAGAGAQGFVDEWFALLKPFSAVATPAMWNGTIRMYDDMERWQGEGDAGFSKRVWDFIGAAIRARQAAGGSVDGPAWLNRRNPS